MRVVITILVCYLEGLAWLLEHAHSSQNMEGLLYDDLFANYNRYVRPRRNYKETVKLSLKLYIEQIVYLDEKEQQMLSTGTMVTKWYDDYLVWNASDYEDIRTLYVPQDMVWIPDMYHPQGDPSYLTQAPGRHNLVVVKSDGLIKKYDVGFLRTKCPIDITYFPFDGQECDIDVSMLVSVVEKVMIAEIEDTTLSNAAANGFWEVLSTSTDITNSTDMGGTYSEASVAIKMVRSPQVYVYFLVVPILLLSSLSVLVFCLPVETVEKVGLSISVLLSFTVFQAMLADIMPAGSKNMPYVAQYNTVAFIISCMCLVATVLVLHVHHKTTSVPPRCKLMVLRLCHSWVASHETSMPQDYPRNPANHEESSTTENNCDNDDRPRSPDILPVDWPMVARLLDRIFFVCFTTVSVVIFLLNAAYFLLYMYTYD